MAATDKSQRTAARIAAAAAELFFDQGFTDTTIAQVADRSNVAAGTVMLHFGSKSDLATAAFADQIATVVQSSVDALADANQTSLESSLAAFVRPIFGWYEANLEVAPDLLREALFAEGKWAEHYTQTVNKTVTAFAQIAAEHRDRDDVALVGEGLLADYFIVLLRGFRGEFGSVDEQIERFVSLARTRFP